MSGYDTNNGSLYDAALAGFFADSKSAQKDQTCRKTLVKRSRILAMTSPIAGAVINKLVSGVIGSGLIYTPFDNNTEFDSDIYNNITETVTKALRYASQTHAIDAQGRLTFSEMLSLIYRTELLSGDVFLLLLPGKSFCSSWYIKESDAVFTPSFLMRQPCEANTTGYYHRRAVYDGVECDHLGRPVAYWFCKNLERASERREWLRIKAVDADGLPIVLHIFQAERPEQFRGLPILSPVIEKLFSVWAYEKADVQMAILESSMASIITTDSPASRDPLQALSRSDLNAPLVPTKKEEENDNNYNDGEFALDPFQAFQRGDSFWSNAVHRRRYISAGQSIHLKPGEDIKFLNPTRPYSGVSGFVDLAMKEIGGVLGVPFQVLQSTYETSFASAKAALATFQQTVTKARTRFIEACLRPMLNVFIYDLFKESLNKEQIMSLTINCDWLSSEARVMVDPSKEIQFYSSAIDLGLVDRDEAAQALFSHAARGVPNVGDGKNQANDTETLDITGLKTDEEL